MKIEFSQAYTKAIEDMAKDMEMSPEAVVKLAVRHFQVVQARHKDGETVTWSGDADRAREFRGTLI